MAAIVQKNRTNWDAMRIWTLTPTLGSHAQHETTLTRGSRSHRADQAKN